MIIKQNHGEDIEERQRRFVELLNPVWNSLARYSNSVAGEREAARDLMSETLLRAFQHFEELRDPSKFKAYLFRIAVRVHQEWGEKNKRQTPLTEELALYLERTTLADDGLAAERSLAAQELYAALDTLPVKQREAIVLFEISGLSLKEVREVQGGSLSGVKSRIVRGREELARKLGVRNPKRDLETDAGAKAVAPSSPNMSRTFAFTGKVSL